MKVKTNLVAGAFLDDLGRTLDTVGSQLGDMLVIANGQAKRFTHKVLNVTTGTLDCLNQQIQRSGNA